MIVTTVDIAIRDPKPLDTRHSIQEVPEVGLLAHVHVGGIGQPTLDITSAHADRLEELGDAIVAAALELRMRQRIQAGAA